MAKQVTYVDIEDRIEDIDALVAKYAKRIRALRREARGIFQTVARVNLTKRGSFKDKRIAADPFFERVLSRSDRIGYGA